MARADPFAVFEDEPTVIGPPPDEPAPAARAASPSERAAAFDRVRQAARSTRFEQPPPSEGVPGSGREAFADRTQSADFGSLAGESADPDGEVPPSGINPLLAAANPLLDLVPQLRVTARHPRPLELREELARQIHRFEERARAAVIDPQTILAARYCLCTLLDEVAATTPWGGSGVWARQSLLVAFHNEAQGGEKFFRLLARLADNPAKHIDLLELLYVCLSLGFEGRYRVIADGRAQLDALRARLAALVARQRGEFDPALSVRWQRAVVRRRSAFLRVPVWVPPVFCGFVLMMAWLRFNDHLNAHSDPVFQRILHVRAQSDAQRTALNAPASDAPVQPRLARLLAPEIAQGLVAVTDLPDRSFVVLRGDDLFASGGAQINARYEHVLSRLATALLAVPGRVLVTGHTDDTPINTLRYPSNWHLSTDRARSVLALLTAGGVPATRIRAEGRAAAEPLVPNDSAEHRARNRRVEVIVFTGGADG